MSDTVCGTMCGTMCKARAATPAHPEIVCTCPPRINYCQDCSFYEVPRCMHVRVATFKGRKNTCTLWTPKDSKGRWTIEDHLTREHVVKKLIWFTYSYLGDSPYTYLWRGRQRLVSLFIDNRGVVMTKKVYCSGCHFFETYEDEFDNGCTCVTGTRDTPLSQITTVRNPTIDNADNNCVGHKQLIVPVPRKKKSILSYIFT